MRIQARAQAASAANEYQGHNVRTMAGDCGIVGLFFVLDMQRLDYADVIKGELAYIQYTAHASLPIRLPVRIPSIICQM